jgi:hypothetical protein
MSSNPLPKQSTSHHRPFNSTKSNPTQVLQAMNMLTLLLRKERKRKDSAGSDDTASMIKGGGYLGARTKQTI